MEVAPYDMPHIYGNRTVYAKIALSDKIVDSDLYADGSRRHELRLSKFHPL
jgi:hypothetical protein